MQQTQADPVVERAGEGFRGDYVFALDLLERCRRNRRRSRELARAFDRVLGAPPKVEPAERRLLPNGPARTSGAPAAWAAPAATSAAATPAAAPAAAVTPATASRGPVPAPYQEAPPPLVRDRGHAPGPWPPS